MQRYLLNIAYIGTRYNGMTRNRNIKNHTSIEGSLLDAVTKTFKRVTSTEIYTSSRTDAGVHALNTSVALDIERLYDEPLKPQTITKLVNEKLAYWNEQLRILKTTPVDLDFNPRFNVISRKYLYRLAVAKQTVESGVKLKQLKSSMFIPIEESHRCHFILNHGFDIERAKGVAKMLEGVHDFRSFMKKSKEQKTTHPRFCLRKLDSIKISPGRTIATSFNRDKTMDEYHFWDIEFKARAYFYRQIRNMVGALVAAAEGKVTQRDIYEMLTIPSHHSWNQKIAPVPPHGLYLVNVEYPEEIFSEQIEKFVSNNEQHCNGDDEKAIDNEK